MSILNRARARRAAGYGLVGITGVPVDLAVVWLAATVAALPAMVATLAGYQVAVTWNYICQRRYVYRSQQPIPREFARYLGADLLGAVARVAVVALLVHAVGVPSTVTAVVPGVVIASAAGIAAGFVATFATADTLVFDTTTHGHD